MRKVLLGLAATAAVLITTSPSLAQRGLLKGGLVMYRYKTDEQRGRTIGGGIQLRASEKLNIAKKRRRHG